MFRIINKPQLLLCCPYGHNSTYKGEIIDEGNDIVWKQTKITCLTCNHSFMIHEHIHHTYDAAGQSLIGVSQVSYTHEIDRTKSIQLTFIEA